MILRVAFKTAAVMPLRQYLNAVVGLIDQQPKCRTDTMMVVYNQFITA
jgi:hypothetical protein